MSHVNSGAFEGREHIGGPVHNTPAKETIKRGKPGKLRYKKKGTEKWARYIPHNEGSIRVPSRIDLLRKGEGGGIGRGNCKKSKVLKNSRQDRCRSQDTEE